MDPMRDLLTTGQVAQALGVSEASLKRWCDKGLLPSTRTAGGHRRLFRSSVFQFLRQSGQPLQQPEWLGLPEQTGIGAKVSSHDAVDLAAQALIYGRESAFRALAYRLYLSGMSTWELFDNVLAEAFHVIGHRWEAGAVETYQERRAVQICMAWIHEIRQILPPPAANAPLAIGASPEQDPYLLPTSMLEVVFLEQGWRASSLGSNVPMHSLCAALRSEHPQLFWLSVSQCDPVEAFLEEYSRLYQVAQDQHVALVIGGRGLAAPVRPHMRWTVYGERFSHLIDFISTAFPHSNPTQFDKPSGAEV